MHTEVKRHDRANPPMSSPDGNGSPPARGMRLLVGVSGAANVCNLPNYLICLRTRLGCEVQVVMTEIAARILPPTTVRLFCNAVFCDGPHIFEPGHMALAAWADQVIVLPATANVLGQVAHGLASDLLCSTLLACPIPLVFFPSMNRLMWERASVQRNVTQLRADGHHIVEPEMTSGWEVMLQRVETVAGLVQPGKVADLITRMHTAAD
jgi:phosphopantothenoylcysteine synthetase/decarboxylase